MITIGSVATTVGPKDTVEKTKESELIQRLKYMALLACMRSGRRYMDELGSLVLEFIQATRAEVTAQEMQDLGRTLIAYNEFKEKMREAGLK